MASDKEVLPRLCKHASSRYDPFWREEPEYRKGGSVAQILVSALRCVLDAPVISQVEMLISNAPLECG